MFHPQVPKRVHSLYPNMKLIVILRNPVDRAYSHFHMNVRHGCEKLSFMNALDAEERRLIGAEQMIKNPNAVSQAHRRYSYKSRGIYVQQLKRWFSYFPRNQFLIIRSQDLRNDPIETLNRVFSFLNMPAYTVNIEKNDKHSNYKPMSPGIRHCLKFTIGPIIKNSKSCSVCNSTGTETYSALTLEGRNI